MGPSDPFFPPPARAVRSPSAPPAPRELGPAAAPTRRPLAPLVGLAAGLAFGIVWVWVGFGAALIVLACGGLGAALAWLSASALRGGLDVAGAWRALLRR